MKQVDELTRERDRLQEYAESLKKRLEALEAKLDLAALNGELSGPRSEPEIAVNRLPGSSLASPMAYVAAGSFLYGEDEGEWVVKPKRKVQVETYWIDVYPVTNLGYLEFVKATGRAPPGHWEGPKPPREILDHPVVNVTYQDAVDYAEWCGKRLPTPVEWQKAARGVDGRRFPWGDEPNVSRLNCRGTGIDTTSAVGRFPAGVSPCGLHEMAGNVAEWVAGRFEAAADSQGRIIRAVCGGSFRDSIMRSQCAARRGYPDGGRAPYVGFRCARDPEPDG
jgi:formylglycine-generating enzyme required for sulfatase activity